MTNKTITISRETFQGLLEGIAYGGYDNNSRTDMFHRVLGEPWETVTMCEADARLLLCGFSYVNKYRKELLAAIRRADEKKHSDHIAAEFEREGKKLPPGFYNCTAEPAKTGIIIKPADPLAHACFTCGKPTVRDKMICEECCYEPLPVPPVGGDVKVLGYQVTRITPTGIARLDRPLLSKVLDGWEPAFKVTELVDRVHVTRLQAEVERLKDRLADANAIANLATANLEEFKEDHQSELTKALELLQNCTDCVRNGEDFDLPVTTMASIDAFRANQSAPADKGQGEPVAWHTDDHLTDKSSTTYDHTTMERWRAKGWPVTPLYAKQPAPTTGYTAVDMSTAAAQGFRDGQAAALVMPELVPAFEAWWESDGQYCRAGGGDYEKTFAYRAYENALAEVTRLNQIKQ